MKVLITGGGSEEPIDNVRSICNFSTGRTASFLAERLSKKNKVTLIQASKGILPEKNENITIKPYRTFQNLKDSLEEECKTKSYQLIIQAAAVSDFSVDTVTVDGKEYKAGRFSKIPSGTDLSIKMKKNPKLVDFIKLWAGCSEDFSEASTETSDEKKAETCEEASSSETENDFAQNEKASPILVAFKLTSNASLKDRKIAVKKVFSSTEKESLSPDYVVSNDLSEIETYVHPCTIYDKSMKIAFQGKTLEDLASFLEGLI